MNKQTSRIPTFFYDSETLSEVIVAMLGRWHGSSEPGTISGHQDAPEISSQRAEHQLRRQDSLESDSEYLLLPVVFGHLEYRTRVDTYSHQKSPPAGFAHRRAAR